MAEGGLRFDEILLKEVQGCMRLCDCQGNLPEVQREINYQAHRALTEIAQRLAHLWAHNPSFGKTPDELGGLSDQAAFCQRVLSEISELRMSMKRFERQVEQERVKDSLAPCPFCGGEAELFEDQPLLAQGIYVRCRGCGARGPWSGTGKSARGNWNHKTA